MTLPNHLASSAIAQIAAGAMAAVKRKRVRLEVAPQRKANPDKPWKVTRDSVTLFEHATFREALSAAKLTADCIVLEGGTVTLKMKRRDGAIRKHGEFTYPRRSDPRRTKG